MAVDEKQADAFLREIMQRFDKDREALDPYTRRLVLKYREAKSRGERVIQDLDQLRNQIKQAEARVRSLELQAADLQGKATGYLDFLVSMKFEDEKEVKDVGRTEPGEPKNGGGGAPAKPGIRAVRSPIKTKKPVTDEAAVS